MTDLEEVRKAWIKEKPVYESFVKRVIEILRSEFRDPTTQIYGRAKEIDSVLKKLIRKPGKTYESMTDKAGIRVVVKYSDGLDKVGSFIERRFRNHKKDDKRESLKLDQVGYQGIHYDIKLNDEEATGTEFDGIWGEIQVRTLAQHLWSDMSHELGYKPDLSVPDLMQRRLFRLSALVELADDEFLRLRDAEQAMPGFNTYKVLGLLEAQFYKFAATGYDRVLSITTINAFDSLYGEGGLAKHQEKFEEFCQRKSEKLSYIFDAHKEVTNRPIFLFQPESLMIFHLLDEDKFKLREEWVKHFPPRELDQLAVTWGTPYAL